MVRFFINGILKLTDTRNHLILVNEEAPLSEICVDEKTCIVKPDIWLLKTIGGRPVAVIILNSPRIYTNALDDKIVIDQLLLTYARFEIIINNMILLESPQTFITGEFIGSRIAIVLCLNQSKLFHLHC